MEGLLICAPNRYILMEEYEDKDFLDQCIQEIRSYLNKSTSTPTQTSSSLTTAAVEDDEEDCNPGFKSNDCCYIGSFSKVEQKETNNMNKCLLPNLDELFRTLNQQYDADFLDVVVSYKSDCDVRSTEFISSVGIMTLTVGQTRKRIHRNKPEISRGKTLEMVVENDNPKEKGRSSSQYSFVFRTHGQR
jgi:hypothetical protein